MKYRFQEVDCTYDFGGCYVTINIQCKKWYGWVTINIIEDKRDKAYDRAWKLLKLLRDDYK